MEVSDQLRVPAASPLWKGPCKQEDRRVPRTRAGLDTVQKIK
jgi:hypothetical protein